MTSCAPSQFQSIGYDSWLTCMSVRGSNPGAAPPKFGAQTPPYPTCRSQRCVKGPSPPKGAMWDGTVRQRPSTRDDQKIFTWGLASPPAGPRPSSTPPLDLATPQPRTGGRRSGRTRPRETGASGTRSVASLQKNINKNYAQFRKVRTTFGPLI